MSQELRTKLLILLEKHSRTRSSDYKSDSDLSKELDISVEEIRKQLDILEINDLIKAANAFDSHNAIISPKGSLAVEQIKAQAKQPKKGPIGFHHEDTENRVSEDVEKP